MPGYTPWIERKFDFNFPVDVYPEIVERLRSTPNRIETLIRNVHPDLLKMRPNGKWSVQEQVGHLQATETLFTGRLDDFEAGLEVLRAADMSNRRTCEANYNEQPMDKIFTELRQVRRVFINRLEGYDPAMFARTAHHPRLNKPMRLVDSLYFQAEHDDHHLVRIEELLNL